MVILASCTLMDHTPMVPIPSATGSTQDDPSILSDEKLSEEFKNLRDVKGQFDGSPWNDEVDRWMGRKHRLMLELEERIRRGNLDKAQVIQWMGLPDQTISPDDILFQELLGSTPAPGKENGTVELLIYYWRSNHDFLYLVCENDQVTHSGWFYAGE
jgi:hypothetical protein